MRCSPRMRPRNVPSCGPPTTCATRTRPLPVPRWPTCRSWPTAPTRSSPSHREPPRRCGSGSAATPGSSPRLPAHRLWSRVADADVLLLPYVWGTHSGLLELASDLGTPVVAGDVGHIRDQAPATLIPVHAGRIDPDLLTDAVDAVLRDPPTPIPIEDRTRALAALRQAHTQLYAELLGRAVRR